MITVRKEIHPTNGTIWIIQQDYQYEVWQEVKDGKEKIKVPPLEGKARKWSYGIENGIYYTALLSAYSVKEQKILLSVPDLVISIDPPTEKLDGYTILCAIYSKDEKTTISLANKFIKDNKPYILFAIEPEINKYPLKIDVLSLLENLSTKPITIEKPKEEKEEKKVEVIIPSTEDGIYVYSNNEVRRVAVNIFGDLFDYMEINTKKLLDWFGYPPTTPLNMEKLKTITLEKFKNKEYITPSDMEEITGIKPNKLEPCKLPLTYKSETMKMAVGLLNKHINISEERANEILREAINKASQEGTQIRSEHLLGQMNDKEKQQFIRVLKKLSEVIKETDKKIDNTDNIDKVVVLTHDKDITELILYGMSLKLRSSEKKIELLNI